MLRGRKKGVQVNDNRTRNSRFLFLYDISFLRLNLYME